MYSICLCDINKLSLHSKRRSFDLMQDEVKYRTSLVSKSLPIKKRIFAIYSNSAIKAIQYALNSGLNEKVVYPHSFRHRFAKNFLEKFNDISLLADLMGHESIETTRIYLRRSSTEQQEIVDKIITW